jgi:hypothetical protein
MHPIIYPPLQLPLGPLPQLPRQPRILALLRRRHRLHTHRFIILSIPQRFLLRSGRPRLIPHTLLLIQPLVRQHIGNLAIEEAFVSMEFCANEAWMHGDGCDAGVLRHIVLIEGLSF